jgi:hypothetical protein
MGDNTYTGNGEPRERKGTSTTNLHTSPHNSDTDSEGKNPVPKKRRSTSKEEPWAYQIMWNQLNEEYRLVVHKLFIVPYPFKISTSSCVPPLAPGSVHSQMLFFCHHCMPATHTHYTIHLLNIRMSVSFCHNPVRGKWQRALSDQGTNNNFAVYLTILHIKPYLLIENCE